MSEDCLKLQQERLSASIIRCDVLGLNIFSANCDSLGTKDLESLPFLRFLAALIRPYTTVSLLGAPALSQWINEMRVGRKQQVTIDDLLGKGVRTESTKVSSYAGRFSQLDESSVLFRVADKSLLFKLIDTFMYWDAVALILYSSSQHDPLSDAKQTLEVWNNETDTIERLLNTAHCLVRSQDDCAYLEVFSNSLRRDAEFSDALGAAAHYITDVPWYQAHRDALVWDDQERCLVIRS